VLRRAIIAIVCSARLEARWRLARSARAWSIARVRNELAEIERLIRGKAQGGQLADLMDRANDVEREAMKEEVRR
jgi:hypothetical protein